MAADPAGARPEDEGDPHAVTSATAGVSRARTWPGRVPVDERRRHGVATTAAITPRAAPVPSDRDQPAAAAGARVSAAARGDGATPAATTAMVRAAPASAPLPQARWTRTAKCRPATVIPSEDAGRARRGSRRPGAPTQHEETGSSPAMSQPAATADARRPGAARGRRAARVSRAATPKPTDPRGVCRRASPSAPSAAALGAPVAAARIEGDEEGLRPTGRRRRGRPRRAPDEDEDGPERPGEGRGTAGVRRPRASVGKAEVATGTARTAYGRR